MNDAVKIMNRRVLKVIGVLVLCVVLVASCVRKPLYDECLCETRLAIPISVDWSVSGVTLQNVSVLFYDADNGELRNELRYQQNANEVQAYAYLPVGNYTAVVFNELRNQIDYVSCVGHENLQTLKFESRAAKPLLSRGPENKYIEQPGELAVAMVEGIEVTSEMILEAAFTKHYEATKAPQLSNPTRATVESLTGIVPKRKTTIVDITAHIKNIYYARMPALVDLVNVADGYCVMQDENSGVPATLQFTMNNRTYDAGSDRDGTISTQITTFGTLGDRDDVTGYDQLPLMVDVYGYYHHGPQRRFDIDRYSMQSYPLQWRLLRHRRYRPPHQRQVQCDVDVNHLRCHKHE